MGHHFESDLAKSHPQLDLSDLYAFESERDCFTVFILCQNPQSKINRHDNLLESGLYNLHIGFDRKSTTGATYTFQPTKDGLRIGFLGMANPPLGSIGEEIGLIRGEEIFEFADGSRAWSGVAKDPFAGNAKGLGIFKEAATRGEYKPHAFDNAQNAFENMLTTAIVIELPNEKLAPKIYYSGTSAMLDHDHWHQVNRIGHVLLPHLYFDSSREIEAQMSSNCASDEGRLQLVATVVEKYARLAGVQSDPKKYGAQIASMVLPDVVPYVIGTPAHYGVNEINGRAMDDPAMDVALHLLVGTALSAQVPPPRRRNPSFPYCHRS